MAYPAHTEIVGLWDKPSAKSFGLLCVVMKAGAEYVISGFERPLVISSKEFAELYDVYQVILLTGSVLSCDYEKPIALWLGREFCEKARELKAPELPSHRYWPAPCAPFENEGQYSIHEYGVGFECISQWVRRSAEEALRKNDASLADLLKWALPDAPETYTAVYFTRQTAGQREREIAWRLRLYGKTRERMLQEYETVKKELLHE